MKKLLLTVVMLLAMSTFVEAKEIKLRATGYYIQGIKSKAELKIEGGKNDRFGNPIRTLQDFIFGGFVTVATDPKIIKTGTVLKIKEFPGITFLACDVGTKIKKYKIDIACITKQHTYQLPKYVHAIPIAYLHNIKQYKNYGFGEAIARR